MNYKLKKIDVFLFITLLIMGYISKIFNTGFSLNLNNYLNLPLYFIIIWRVSIEVNFIHFIKLRIEKEKSLLSKSILFILKKTTFFTISTLMILTILTIIIKDIDNLATNIYHYAFAMSYYIVLVAILGIYFQEEKTFYIASFVMICMFIFTFLNIGREGVHEYLITTFPKDINIILKTVINLTMLYLIYYGLRKWKYEV